MLVASHGMRGKESQWRGKPNVVVTELKQAREKYSWFPDTEKSQCGWIQMRQSTG